MAIGAVLINGGRRSCIWQAQPTCNHGLAVVQLNAPTIITSEDLEHQLTLIRASVADPMAGLFGPGSITWRVEREAALFLAAGRALMLQLAHPWIAAAVGANSRAMTDPVGRFHRTFSVMFSMVFGTLDQALGAARRLHQRHSAIAGTLDQAAGPYPKGAAYCASELAALRWVAATLTDSALLAHDLLLPPLTGEERERYYAESKLFAALFGIPPTSMPSDWSAFKADTEHMLTSGSLCVTSTAHAIADQMLRNPARRWLRVPLWYVPLTAHMLPPPLREAFQLPYGPAQRDAAERALSRMQRVYRILPGRLRHVGPYHEACGRLSGQRRPGLLTQALNRFWIGQGAMS
jgi:uncharacterized protein (DUF2236 family)